MNHTDTSRGLFALAPILLSALVLGGCNSAPVRDPAYAPARPVAPPPEPTGDGSLYHDGYALSWFEDLRAHRVGDLLTVRLVERTQADKAAKTSAKKSTVQNIDNPTLLGMKPKFTGPQGLGAGDLSFATKSEHDFKGESASSQSNTLNGDITVTVVQVLGNGNLMVRGEKRLGINQGNEYIRLSGIVRPWDVSADNSVESTKIADPTITYVGDGAVADANAMGWLARFFISALMPF